MFNWFRRRLKLPKPQQPSRKTEGSRSAPPLPGRTPGEPSLLPEVVAEGSTEADWSAWEDSMTTWDSQLGGLAPSNGVHVRDTRPSQLDEPDPFAALHRKRDI